MTRPSGAGGGTARCGAILAFVWLLAAVGWHSAAAQTAAPRPSPAVTPTRPPGVPAELRVAVKPLEPFVVSRAGNWEGFSIELWQHLAKRLGVTTEWLEVATVEDQLAAVREGRVDAAIAGITMTAEREKTIDFTHPYFDAGLQVLVPDNNEPAGFNILHSYASVALLEILLVGIAFALVLAHCIWLIERRENPEFEHGYLRGVWEGLWWVQAVIATGEYPNRTTRSAFRRIMTIGFWLLGVILIAQFTAAVTSDLTVNMLSDTVTGPGDLPGKDVVTVQGTTAATWLRNEQIPAVEVPRVEDAYLLLHQGGADALVFDAPVLQYYAATRGQGKAHVVGKIFRPEKYGIALPPDSPLRRLLNTAILEMYQDGSYDELHNWWFGSGEVPGG
jgi:ABC-type amino acid transport substrate-binding protein